MSAWVIINGLDGMLDENGTFTRLRSLPIGFPDSHSALSGDIRPKILSVYANHLAKPKKATVNVMFHNKLANVQAILRGISHQVNIVDSSAAVIPVNFNGTPGYLVQGHTFFQHMNWRREDVYILLRGDGTDRINVRQENLQRAQAYFRNYPGAKKPPQINVE